MMSARILLFLYLLRDTLHRWGKRLSSPVARLLVVFSLSFSGLIFLCNYAISIRLLEERIAAAGADLLVVGEYVPPERPVPTPEHTPIPARSGEFARHMLYELFVSAKAGHSHYPLVEYLPDMAGLLPRGGNAVFVLPEKPVAVSSPVDIELAGHHVQGVLLPEQHAGFLRKLYARGVVLVPQGNFSLGRQSGGVLLKYVLRMKEVSVSRVKRWEDMLNLLSRLDQRNMTIISSRAMLQELEQLREVQQRFRLGVVSGCSLIICVLLTAISSMEFRQNEYVYALIGSFGISRFWLFMTFVLENILLVASGFACTLLCLSRVGPWMVKQLYGMEEGVFSMDNLAGDIRIFCMTFAVSVLVSCVPILGAIRRPIGKILK